MRAAAVPPAASLVERNNRIERINRINRINRADCIGLIEATRRFTTTTPPD